MASHVRFEESSSEDEQETKKPRLQAEGDASDLKKEKKKEKKDKKREEDQEDDEEKEDEESKEERKRKKREKKEKKRQETEAAEAAAEKEKKEKEESSAEPPMKFGISMGRSSASKEKAKTPEDVAKWSALSSSLGSNQSKFMKLMGAGKGKAAGSEVVAPPAEGIKKADYSAIQKQLQEQYESAQRMRGRSGLG